MLPFVGAVVSFSTICTGKSAPRRIPAYLSSIPWPWVAKTVMRFSAKALRKVSTARSTSPRMGSIAEYSRNVVSGSKSVPKGLSSLALMPALEISVKSSSQARYVPAPS